MTVEQTFPLKAQDNLIKKPCTRKAAVEFLKACLLVRELGQNPLMEAQGCCSGLLVHMEMILQGS